MGVFTRSLPVLRSKQRHHGNDGNVAVKPDCVIDSYVSEHKSSTSINVVMSKR